MKLKFIVPIFDFNYIGENKSSKDMWSKAGFHENLKDYQIDSTYKIILTKNDNFHRWDKLNTDILSKQDVDILQLSLWLFKFNCSYEDLDSYKQKLNLLLLAFRISKLNDLSIKYIICENAPHLSVKYSDDWKYAIAEKIPQKETEEVNSLDLDNIIIVYKRLQDFFKVSPRTAHAVNFLFLAYNTYYWMEAFLLLMTALETLMSPDKIGAIVSIITTRSVGLINDKKICNKSKFTKIYTLRSDIVHGKVLVELNFEKELPKLQQLQKIVLSTFNMLLQNDFRSIYKDEKSKEIFYSNVTNSK